MAKEKDEILNVVKLLENSELFYGVLVLLINRYVYEHGTDPALVANKIMGDVVTVREPVLK